MTWILLATSSIIFFSTLNLLQRKIAINTKYPRATSVVFNLWAALIAILIFIITGSYKTLTLPSDPAAWIFLTVACLGYGLFERGRFIAAKLLDASVLTIVSDIAVVIAFVFSLILYRESLSLEKVIGAGLIVFALILIGLTKNKHKISMKGVGIALLIYSFLALGWSLDKKGATFFNPDTYQILIWLIPLVVIYFPYVRLSEIKYEIRAGSWKVVILAFLNVVGYLLQLKAVEIADATKVIPVVQTSTLLTVFLGIVILGEKDDKFRKIIASIIALIGTYIVIVAR